jgi:hypothetical protein
MKKWKLPNTYRKESEFHNDTYIYISSSVLVFSTENLFGLGLFPRNLKKYIETSDQA